MKKLKTILSLIIVGVCMLIAYLSYRYYAPPSYRQPYLMKIHKTDTLHVAYIGDSWAFMHKNHMCRIAQILVDILHRPVKVHSYGICGATSKEIYENMFNNSDLSNFLQQRTYAYCFISAGINDTYKKMNVSYYQKSMDYIIQFLLINHIHPIIQEIPDYNIQRVFERQTLKKKIIRRISMFVNGTDIDCKQQFRDALDELINTKNLQDKVTIIRYKSWNKSYEKDLKELYIEDQMHLNEKGYSVLDSVIGKEIAEQILTPKTI